MLFTKKANAENLKRDHPNIFIIVNKLIHQKVI